MGKAKFSKLGYALFNFLLALLCIPFAMSASALASIFVYVVAVFLILYGIYACFEHGFIFGLICIVLGVVVIKIDSETVLNWMLIVASVAIALFLYGLYSSPNNNVSKILYRIFPIPFVAGSISFVINNDSLLNLYYVAFALWIIGIIFELKNWDSAPKRRSHNSGPHTYRSSSSYQPSTPRLATNGDVERAMSRVASNYSRKEYLSYGTVAQIKTTCSVFAGNIKFVININFVVGNITTESQANDLKDEMQRFVDRYASNIMDDAKNAFNKLNCNTDYNLNIEIGHVEYH